MPNHFDAVIWAKQTPFEQLGNIGSEVGRTMSALQRGDDESARGASLRAFDLIDATVRCWTSEARRRELLRAREEFAAAVDSQIPNPSLDAYFFQFALAARAQR